MSTMFKNSKNSKTSEPHRLLLYLQGKMSIKGVINILLYEIWAYYIHGKILKNDTKTNLKCQVHCGIKFELPDESYSLSDMQDYL